MIQDFLSTKYMQVSLPFCLIAAKLYEKEHKSRTGNYTATWPVGYN